MFPKAVELCLVHGYRSTGNREPLLCALETKKGGKMGQGKVAVGGEARSTFLKPSSTSEKKKGKKC